jgi:glycine cleavage system aminomethyltransferase T
MSDPPLTTKLYFGPWYRRSPFFEATQRAGCQAYDIYNKMYLPAEYDDPAVEYRTLDEGVTLWDVGVERTVQVSGADADRFVDMLTCRDLTRCAVKQGKYMIVTAPDGGIVNDPVLLHVDSDLWWMQLADSDAGLYALGVLSQTGLDAEVSYPDVHPVQVQGPRSGETLAKLVGSVVLDLRYYWCDRFQIGDIPVVISRTGWTAVPGFEVNLLDGSRGDELWDAIMSAGEEFDIRPIAPNEARRVEAGIFNYGSDMTLRDTPFHVMGLERLVEEQSQDYIGKAALERIRREGVDRKLVGIRFDSDEPILGITRPWLASREGREVGQVTDAVWSPGLAANIGYVWVPVELAAPGTAIDVDSEHGQMTGRTAAIPFVDPNKQRPAQSLRGTVA